MSSDTTAATACPTCGVYPSVTGAETLNRITRRLIAEGRIQLGTLPPRVQDGLPDNSLFRFGFNDFIPDACTDTLIGRWQAAIKVDGTIRFFACVVSNSGMSVPQEYQHGGLIEISGQGIYGMDSHLLLQDESLLELHLQRSLNALREFVIARIG